MKKATLALVAVVLAAPASTASARSHSSCRLDAVVIEPYMLHNQPVARLLGLGQCGAGSGPRTVRRWDVVIDSPAGVGALKTSKAIPTVPFPPGAVILKGTFTLSHPGAKSAVCRLKGLSANNDTVLC